MKYYLIAGEASGDLHGSNLIRALRQQDAKAELRAWGGDLMQEAGAEVVKHYRDLAFMGFWEVATNIRTILGNLRRCKEDILQFQPDALILIDYPGFNLRIARWAHQQGLRVFYYISPQLWAWHSSRVNGIKTYVDRMFVILPFEPDFYARYDFPVDFVGHPLLDVVEGYQPTVNLRRSLSLSEGPIVAALPGSRQQEIRRMLPTMLKVADRMPEHNFVIAGAPAIPATYYETFLAAAPPNVHLISGQTYDLLQQADVAMVTSGTATLETALFGLPQVVGYRGGALSYFIARRLVNVDYISLVNLILDRPLVRELIQQDYRVETLQEALAELFEPGVQEKFRAAYVELQRRLGQAGASERTAKLVVDDLRTVG